MEFFDIVINKASENAIANTYAGVVSSNSSYVFYRGFYRLTLNFLHN
jgi:hypothetical protein